MNKKITIFFIFLILISFITCKRNKPPETPTVVGPTKVGVGAHAEYKAVATDPNKDDVRYHFSWNGQRETTDFYKSGDTGKVTITFEKADTYLLKVQAEDIKGTFSEECSLTIEVVTNQKPQRPTLTGPSSGLINKKYSFTAQTTDPDNDSIRYKFIWGNGQEKITDWVASGTPVTESISYSDTGVYVIKVVAQDNKYVWSDTSDEIRFEVKKELTAGDILFIFSAEEEIISSPAITIYGGDTLVIFGDNGGNIYAIDASSGALRYRGNALPGDDLASSPVIGPDGVIYVGGAGEGRVYAFNPNLTRKWVYPESAQAGLGSISGTPVISADGNKLFIGSDNETLYCLSTANGQVLWKFKAKGSIEGSCIMDNEGNIYFGENDSGYFYKLSPNGEVRWEIYLGDPIYGQGAINNNLVYVAVMGKIYGISLDGRILYRASFTDTTVEVYGGPVIGWDGKVIVATEEGYIEVFEPDLTKIYSYQKTPSLKSTPCLAGTEEKVLYINNDGDRLYAINPLTENGAEYFPSVSLTPPSFVKKLQPDFISSPVVGNNGIVYVANGEYLFAIVGYKQLPLANTAWPMFQHDPKHTGRAGGKR
ncbi:MAG: PQQ-binding-like beta-propeller repeat protein [candidate division WOR-3 bacterium]|nr:PQQ-binding-like beta-propeller repeat protein [candidate division WOR-3 bacterium]MCX7836784.1 PQQ-binding-like beta-propeller repeat protein [candidate division WOR-3 bacterium]MDW8113578.1 PQQ-binding-like beta-propeller repeat protein [candidate division WOR-3 bacterium]